LTSSEGVAGGFLNTRGISTMLSKSTHKLMMDIFSKGFSEEDYNQIVFFPSTMASTNKIMRIWARAVCLCTKGQLKLDIMAVSGTPSTDKTRTAKRTSGTPSTDKTRTSKRTKREREEPTRLTSWFYCSLQRTFRSKFHVI
jgi:hypothetical protein